MRLWAAPCLLLVTGCFPSHKTTQIDFPPTGEAKSLLIATQKHSELRLFAFSLEPQPQTLSIDFVVEANESAALEALTYNEDLEHLGLQAGEVRTTSEVPSCELPKPKVVFFSRLSGTDVSPWQIVPSMSSLLSSQRIEDTRDRCGCAHFEPKLFELETNFKGTFLVTLDENTVLAGAADGRLYRVTAEPPHLERQSVAPSLASERFTSATKHNEDIWLGSTTGAVWRVRLEGGLLTGSQLTTIPTASEVRGLSVVQTSTSVELFTLSIGGGFFAWDGRWRQIASIRTPLDNGYLRPTPRGAVIFSNTSTVTIHYEDGALTRHDIPVGADLLRSMAYVQAIGPVLGTMFSGLFYQDDGWRTLGNPNVSIKAITSYESGLMFGSDNGVIGQYLASGFCPNQLLAGGEVASRMTVMGRHVVTLPTTHAATTERTGLTLLLRK